MKAVGGRRRRGDGSMIMKIRASVGRIDKDNNNDGNDYNNNDNGYDDKMNNYNNNIMITLMIII